ncbi:hypothetical protein C0J52_20464 [Blattella germanica]|uniref:Chemosensory protein n=1 Tax=Blattella germanica TaxID=6973 RepID=A0A0X8DBI2_BLAGE|nr:chemosensory protein [Blattella germanica]PSN31007.1 hypothetical protein C0J52_20464 [Blattella germanica]
MMKLQFIFVSVLLYTMSVRCEDERFAEEKTECNKLFPTADEAEEHLRNLGSLPDESDKTALCFIHCIMEKTGMINEEKELQAPVIVEKLKGFPNGTEIENLEEMVEKCVEENTQEDHCEKAYGFAKCIMTSEINTKKEE